MFGTERAGAVRELRRDVRLDMKPCLGATAAARSLVRFRTQWQRKRPTTEVPFKQVSIAGLPLCKQDDDLIQSAGEAIESRRDFLGVSIAGTCGGLQTMAKNSQGSPYTAVSSGNSRSYSLLTTA